jgi:hypothetical protein
MNRFKLISDWIAWVGDGDGAQAAIKIATTINIQDIRIRDFIVTLLGALPRKPDYLRAECHPEGSEGSGLFAPLTEFGSSPLSISPPRMN